MYYHASLLLLAVSYTVCRMYELGDFLKLNLIKFKILTLSEKPCVLLF